MQVTFLGAGAAFSSSQYNACALVDRTILLDAGPPLCVHLPKVGVRLDEPRICFISHFHADHTFGLAQLVLGRALLVQDGPPLQVFGPRGTEAYLRQLLDFAWGEEMRRLSWKRLQLSVRELGDGDRFSDDGVSGQAFTMRHTPRLPCLGFVLQRDGMRLGYTGDAEMSDGLERLLSSCDHVIAEMTSATPSPLHLSRTEIVQLMESHPALRFILTHRGVDDEVPGAVLARDFQTLQLPLR